MDNENMLQLHDRILSTGKNEILMYIIGVNLHLYNVLKYTETESRLSVDKDCR